MGNFFRKPKLLKDNSAYVDWPYILPQSEGMSFNPIRPQGCLHWVALIVVIWLIAAFVGIGIDVVEYVFKILMGVQT